MVNKRFKHFLTICVIATLSFNVIFFILEDNVGEPKFDGLFWISCAFTNIALIGYLIVGKKVFANKELTNFYYNLSELRIIYIGIIANIAISIVFTFSKSLEQWIGTIICVIIFAIICIYVIKADTASQTVQEIDNTLSNKVSKMKDLTSRANRLYKQSDNKKIRESLKILCNEFKFSSYSSDDKDSNNKIESYLSELESKIDDETEVDRITKKLIKLLKAR